MPDFFRTETWHPLTVHFPIVLLVVATLFKLISLKSEQQVWHLGGTILLYAGVVMAWVTIFTGDMADGIVSRAICDPTVLYSHESNAYIVAWIFSAAAAIDILFRTVKNLQRNVFKIALVVLMMIGTGFLTYVGHLGATLVYQQAAGVYVPSEDCSEFE